MKSEEYATNNILREKLEESKKTGISSKELGRLEEELVSCLNRFVPIRYRFADITETEAEEVKKLLNQRKGQFIFGSTGVGKTFRLYGIYRFLTATGHNCKIFNYIDILSEIKKSYDSGSSEDLENYSSPAVLLLDDMGVEKNTEWVNEITYKILNYRYENMLPTFFASNLSLEELAKKIGDRIPSRIAEMCKIVKMTGDDKRV